VSRELLTLAERRRCDAIADHEAEVAGLYRQIDRLNLRIDSLLDRALPVPASPVMATPVREPRTPDVISKAIREEAGTDTRLAAFLRKRAKELKTEHKDWEPQQIADELSQWQSTADDGLA
jgi:hypothetical protein